MSPKKILYSERYPNYKETIRRIFNENELATWLFNFKKKSSDLEPSLRYVPNPKRQESKRVFMKRIIEFSQKYNLDIDLFEGESSYVAYLYVPTFPYRGFFKTELMILIQICDDTYFSSPEELEEANYGNWEAKNWTSNDGYLIVAIYYTHDIFIGDVKLTDLDE